MAAGDGDGVDRGIAMLVSLVCASRRAWPRTYPLTSDGVASSSYGFKLAFARLVRAATRCFGVPFVAALRPAVAKLLESATTSTITASTTTASSAAAAMRVDERGEQCVAAECIAGVWRGVRYWRTADSAPVIEWASSVLVDAMRKGTPTDTSKEWLTAVCFDCCRVGVNLKTKHRFDLLRIVVTHVVFARCCDDSLAPTTLRATTTRSMSMRWQVVAVSMRAA